MKKILLLIHFLIIPFLSIAQSPNGFNYQAIVRDANGDAKVNQNVNFTFTIHTGTASGTIVYTEEHAVQTNDKGLITLNIGKGTTNDDLSSIDWSTGVYFLKVTVDNVDLGTSQLMSVPYAMYANNASNGITQDQADAIVSNTTAVNTVSSAVNDPNTGLTALGNSVVANTAAVNTVSTAVNHPNTGLTALGNSVVANTAAVNTVSTAVNDPNTGLTALGNSITANTAKVAGASATEIGYLSGVTSSIQTQINALSSGAATDINSLSDAKITTADSTFYLGNIPANSTGKIIRR